MGLSTKQVAALMGKGERTIQEYLSVLSAPAVVQTALEERRISFSAAIELARDGISKGLLTRVLTKAVDDALSVHEVRRLLRSAKAATTRTENPRPEQRSIPGAGNGFRPIRIRDLGPKGFDLTVKFRPHRVADYEEILRICHQIIEQIEEQRRTISFTHEELS
jgi:hypothetical protein